MIVGIFAAGLGSRVVCWADRSGHVAVMNRCMGRYEDKARSPDHCCTQANTICAVRYLVLIVA